MTRVSAAHGRRRLPGVILATLPDASGLASGLGRGRKPPKDLLQQLSVPVKQLPVAVLRLADGAKLLPDGLRVRVDQAHAVGDGVDLAGSMWRNCSSSCSMRRSRSSADAMPVTIARSSDSRPASARYSTGDAWTVARPAPGPF